MGKKLAALGSFVVGAALCASPSAGAVGFEVDASLDELTTLDRGSYYGFENITISADLSTTAFFDFDDQTGVPGAFYVVDVSADTKREVELPRSPTSFERLVAIDDDGSTALVVADWEGVAPGDGDGGLADAFLLDTATGELTLLTGDLGEVSVFPLSMDDAGDTILLAVYRTDGEGSLYIAEGGTLQELTDLPDSAFANSYVAQLSGDGSSLLYSTQIGPQTRWHLRDLDSGDESAVAAPSARPHVSFDGSVVVSVRNDTEMSSILTTWDTSTTVLDTTQVDGGAFDFELNDEGDTIIAAGYLRIGVENYQSQLVSIELASGQRTVLWSDPYADLEILGANAGLDTIIVQSRTPILPVFPVPAEAIYGGFGEQPSTYVIDFGGEPVELQLPGHVGSLDDQMARLYEAYFDRAPDVGGLAFWREQRAGGRSLASVSDEFARSPEFVATYGALGDEAFVDLVYRNVLGRDPDAGGRAFWLDQLMNGRTRGSLMTLFSESPEFISTTGTQAAPSAVEAAVGRLYSAMFGRQPDAAGLAFWVSEANRGVSLDQIAAAFIRTDEFQALYGGFEVDAYSMLFVVYRNGMNREIDDAGVELADQFYSAGRTIEELIVEVTNSPEFVAATSTTPLDG